MEARPNEQAPIPGACARQHPAAPRGAMFTTTERTFQKVFESNIAEVQLFLCHSVFQPSCIALNAHCSYRAHPCANQT